MTIKEKLERLKKYYSNLAIVGRQQGRAYEQAKNYILACDTLGIKDIKITLIDSDDKKIINKAIEYIINKKYWDGINNYRLSNVDELLEILKGDSNANENI